jgi:hypothetical protein
MVRIVIFIGGFKSMDLTTPPGYKCEYYKDLSCTDPNYSWAINTQRYSYFSSPPIQTISSLLWGYLFI